MFGEQFSIRRTQYLCFGWHGERAFLGKFECIGRDGDDKRLNSLRKSTYIEMEGNP